MPTEVTVPEMGESINEAVILRWMKHDGDQVALDEPLCELETDKATFDLPAPAAGQLKTTKEVGATVRVGEAVARIDEVSATAPAAPVASETPPRAPRPQPPEQPPAAPKTSSETTEKPAAPPAVAPEKSEAAPAAAVIEPLRPTRTPSTLTAHKSDAGNGEQRQPPAKTESRPAVPATTSTLTDDVPFDSNGTRRVPMSKIRRKIAERLVRAQHTAAMLTTFNEIDMTAVLDLREQHKTQFEQVHGVSLGLMSFFSHACVLALKQFPAVNAEIDGNDIIYHQHVHLAVAVSTERGLVVPVIRHIENMSFAQIESEIKRVAGAARDGKLSLQELSGGTFTITNGGVFGSLLSTPILNPPQTGILGLHTIQKRPVVINDEIKARRMMYVALSYDHRLVDGRDAVSFLVKLKKLIEDPVSMILEI